MDGDCMKDARAGVEGRRTHHFTVVIPKESCCLGREREGGAWDKTDVHRRKG